MVCRPYGIDPMVWYGIAPRISTMSGRTTSGFHRLGRHGVHQARCVVRISPSRRVVGGGGMASITKRSRLGKPLIMTIIIINVRERR